MKYSYNFCPNCGNNFTKELEILYVCKSCDFRIYITPKPTVSVLLFNSSGQLLLARRNNEPAKGKLSVIGGFVDLNETNEEALEREIKEEIGIKINKFNYFGTYTGVYRYKNVDSQLITTFYKSTIDYHAKITLSDEMSEFVFIDIEKIKIKDIGLEVNKKAVKDLIVQNIKK